MNNKLPEDFFKLVETIYKNDPYYFGESDEFVRYLVEQNPFKTKIMVDVNKSTRGIGIIHEDFKDEDKKAALFGFFESMDNENDCKKFFKKLEIWARENAVSRIIGPINFTTFLSYRVRLNHFDRRPFTAEPYNKPYYQGLLESCGYTAHQLYHSYKITEIPETAIKHIKDKTNTLKINKGLLGLDIIPLNKQVWMEHLEHLYGFIDATFKLDRFYYPIPQELFLQIYGESLGSRICPGASRVILNEKKDPVAFMMNFPDYSELGPNSKGHSYENDFKHLKDRILLIKSVGVHPQYRNHNLFNYLLQDILEFFQDNFNGIMVCLVQDKGVTDKFTSAFYSNDPTNYAVFKKDL